MKAETTELMAVTPMLIAKDTSAAGLPRIDRGIADRVEKEACYNCCYCPAEYLGKIFLCGDVAHSVCDEAHKDAHQELDHKGDRSLHDIYGIHQVRDRKAESAAGSSVETAEDQSAQHAERVAEVNCHFITRNGGNRDR